MEEKMVSFVVINRSASPPNGLGSREFKVEPMVGDLLVGKDDDETAVYYKVVARVLASEARTAGDLIVSKLGDAQAYSSYLSILAEKAKG